VITCNKCGYKAPDGAYNCPRCGSPLSTRMEGGPGSRMGGQDQAEIPAWLETLRVGERPAAPVNNSTDFSAADLIEDGSLPSWMRSGRPQSPSSSVSDAFNALHPVSGSSPLTDQGSISQKGLDAQSLIDEKSLPSWMREGSSPSTPSTGFEAASLIDSAALPDWMRSLQPPESSPAAPQSAQSAPDAAPDWMRSLQPPESSPAAPQSAQSAPDAAPDWMRSLQPSQPSSFSAQPSSAMPSSGPVAPSSKGFSARDLLDEQSLPSWMAQQNGQPGTPNNGQPVQPGLLSPSSLIDQNALPSWMAQQSGSQPNISSPNNGRQSVQPGSLSPSSLIDQNALPAWMQEDGNAPSRVPSPPVQPSPSWQVPAQPSMQSPLAQNSAGPNGALAASSFIDNNSLPDWMRSGAGQPSSNIQPQQPQSSQLGVYSGPPHVENMRVPSRPRGEVNPNDGSEVAANVFASMLGVTSTAPQLPPSSSAQAPYGQQQPGQYSPSQSLQQNPSMGGPGQMPSYNNAAGMAQQGSMPNAGAPGMNQQGYASGSYGVGYASNPANRSSLGVPSPGVMPPQSYNAASSAQADDQKSSKKRGLVDTLLGWLLH
jgi:hypothetical protein